MTQIFQMKTAAHYYMITQENQANASQRPSVYDVHTDGVGLRWTHADGWSAPGGRPHRKLETTDVILSSSHAKKFVIFFVPEFHIVFGQNKKWKFFIDCN